MPGFLLPDEELRMQQGSLAPTPDAPADTAFLLPGEQPVSERAAQTLRAAIPVNPDQAGEQRRLAATTGVPVPVVERNLERVKVEARLREIRGALAESPILARQLADPEFARLAHDDVDNLKGIADTIKPSRGPDATIGSVTSGVLNALPQALRAAREGIRLQFADIFGFKGMQEDATRKAAGVATETALSTPEFESSTARGVYSGLTSIVQQAPGIALSIATGNPAPALALMGVQSEAQAYTKYRARGASPVLAGLGALGEGATEVLTEMSPMSFLVGRFGRAGAGEFLTGLLAREVPGEQIATLVQDALDTAIANPTKTWGQYAAERPDAAWQTLVATVTQAGITAGTGVVARRLAGAPDPDQANNDADALAQLLQLAQASKVRERDASSFQTYVDAAAEDGPVQDIHVSAAVFAQAAGENLPAIAQAMPSVAAQISEAIQTGGDLVIPLGEFAANIPGTGLEQALIDNIRTGPDAMTRAEAATFMQAGAEEFRQEAEKILADQATDDAFKQSSAAVEADLLAQLKAVSRFTDDVNKPYAAMVSSFYTTLASRLGITPQEMYGRYPLRIAASNVQGERTLDQLTDEDRIAVGGMFRQEANEAAERTTRRRQFAEQLARDAAPLEMINMVDGEHVVVEPDETAGKFRIKDGKELGEYATLADAIEAALAKGYVPQSMLYDPASGRILYEGTKGNARGQIAFGGDITQTPSVITLLKNADLSTFLHENGHFFLEVLTHVASQPNAPQQLADDMGALLKWLGVADLATWNAMSTEEKRPHHEQFARGFEAYLFEGKSPNVEMNGIFARFRAWLVNVYKQLTALNVTLTDEVRSVMDRLLATDEQIAVAESARGYMALFKSAEEMGATEAEWKAYQELGAEQTQQAVEQLQTRGLRDMKWLANARSRALKALQKEAAGQRAVIEAEVREEVRRQPVYAVQRFLRFGEVPQSVLFAEGVTLDGKLDLAALKEMYGEDPAAPWRYLSVGKNGLAAAEGLDPDLVAELFGFRSGDHLVREILAAEPEASVIEGMTDQRMLERYGDLSSPQGLERAVDESLHNDARARFIATELNALAKATGQKKVLAKAAKQFAEAIIGRKKVREVKPAQYTAAEARAARAAEKAKTLPEKAAEKRNQLVNHYAARAAHDALREVERGIAYLKKLDSEAARKRIDPGYMDQIDQLLERFDLRAGQSLKAIDKRTALAEWITAQEDMGFEPTISDQLRNEAFRKSFKDMTVEEVRGLVDAVRNIEHLGRLKKKLLTAADEREFEAVVNELVTSIRDNATGTVAERRQSDRGLLVEAGRLFRNFAADHRKFASLAREMDGWQDAGAMWEYLVRAMNKAGDTEAVMREQATIKLGELLKPILKAGNLGKKRDFAKSGKTFTREETLAIALNMGNEANRERVVNGEGMTADAIVEVLDTLTKEDWDFVQGVWDYFETFRPQIAAKERRLTGVEPEWVEPLPINTKFGQYKGGYYPIAYDTERSSKSEADSAAQVQRQLERGLYTRAQTRRGHLKARSESTGRPLRYSLAVITQHVDQVVHDLAWHEYLIDANRLMRAAGVDAAIREHYGPEKLRTMKQTLTDIAVGDLAAQNSGERILNYIRHGATVAGLGWRVTTSLLQPLGLTQSMVRIGSKWVLRGAKHWIGDAVELENSVRIIGEKSDFMRLRAKTMQREINEIRNKVQGGDSRLEASYFWLIQKMQLVADVPTWWGAYEKAMAGPDMTEAKAIALADQAVRDAQGGGQIGDLAAIQRGGAGWKLFTNFYSFFNTTYNLTRETIGRTRSAKDAPMLAADLLLLYTVPAMLNTLMKAALAGDWDEEDKLVRRLIADQLTYLLGTVVLVREAGGALQAALGLRGEYGGPASVRIFGELSKLATQAQQGEPDEAFWKALNSVGGMIFHYPAGQINATADGIVSLATGETQNPGALLVGAK
jgi:hypothetical protein